MRFLVAILFSILIYNSHGQKQIINVDKMESNTATNYLNMVGVEPFVNVRFVRLKQGTPYFKDDWMPAVAISDRNISYHAERVKLDLINNEVHLLSEKNEEMVSTIKLKQIEFKDPLSGSVYSFLHSSYFPFLSAAKKGWYMLLVDGTATLYVNFEKMLQEHRQVNLATTDQIIHTTEKYFISHNGSWFQVKKLRDIPGILSNKQKELEDYLKSEVDKERPTSERLTNIVKYFNSL
jgi:hypothetical protein